MLTSILSPVPFPPLHLPPDCHIIHYRGALRDAIDLAPGDHLLLLDPSDFLEPAALPALRRAASAPNTSGAIGRFRFTSPIGDLPIPVGTADPFDALPGLLSTGHLLSLRPIPGAALINRTALADLRPRADLPPGPAAFDLLLQLAARAPFAFSPELVTRRRLNPLTDFDSTLSDLALHIRLLADHIPAHILPTAAADLIDAVIVLRAFQRSLALRGDEPLATATRFPSLFAQWWHRGGLFGPAPRHILHANGGLAEAIFTDPNLIAKRLLSLCPRAKPPILLGLGRNARPIARALHEAGLPIRGRDDNAAPSWAAEDNLPLELIPAHEPFDPAATYIMTVLHDDAFLARLPAGLNILRWRTMPDLILAEWRSAALEWSLRTSTPEPLARAGAAT
ncbi:MAG: hypothetical protein KF678_04675 [Phycisphaeraceae bacterium]|nr:hypothetical protein [Phycisphaeraceae bacterium]